MVEDFRREAETQHSMFANKEQDLDTAMFMIQGLENDIVLLIEGCRALLQRLDFTTSK